ncbi:hypothetical protein Poli38472_009100 [Pythium oligandrum]|uniref:Uncharacterized protein n=1 Tax=Pythium oligandrum TaxID=41045 RepID=A0A8K1FNS8_PYTOL|nr:hypothetical protein Poli38472_009100 [Pythium oligandrum]|eukprot:TMW64933.1 hypothetical protein Poli38472_009100 [Pythium oligandrum]
MAAGRDPTLGPYSILGDNDFPYEDRCVVCVRRGRTYKPMRVRDAVSPRYAVEVPDQVSTGYRAISRDSIVLSEDATAHWTNACSMLAVTITNLAKSCTLLGYDVLTDRLNVAREDDTVWQIADSLLVLIIPVSDNALFGRFVIPSSNGSACILRLEGAYVTPTMAEAWIWGIDRHIVEQSMREWLGAHKGSWRHGWLHNSDTGSIWYEDMFNSKQNSLGFLSSRFEGWTGTEMDCTTRPSVCKHLATDCRWGDTLHTSEQLEYLQLILAGDGTGEGLFQLNFIKTLKIWNVYTLALLVSNASVMIILSHWLIAICALHRNYRHQHEAVPTVSIGVLSNNKGFVLLPLVLLPRLRVALAAFFTVGCAFEGEQLTLSEAWFVIYPGIAQVLLFTFSAFNLAVKVCRRRMSDALFGPMLIFFCSLHLLKQPLANSTWLGYDGRIPTVISSSEYETLTLLDFFTTDVALRMNASQRQEATCRIEIAQQIKLNRCWRFDRG